MRFISHVRQCGSPKFLVWTMLFLLLCSSVLGAFSISQLRFRASNTSSTDVYGLNSYTNLSLFYLLNGNTAAQIHDWWGSVWVNSALNYSLPQPLSRWRFNRISSTTIINSTTWTSNTTDMSWSGLSLANDNNWATYGSWTYGFGTKLDFNYTVPSLYNPTATWYILDGKSSDILSMPSDCLTFTPTVLELRLAVSYSGGNYALTWQCKRSAGWLDVRVTGLGAGYNRVYEERVDWFNTTSATSATLTDTGARGFSQTLTSSGITFANASSCVLDTCILTSPTAGVYRLNFTPSATQLSFCAWIKPSTSTGVRTLIDFRKNTSGTGRVIINGLTLSTTSGIVYVNGAISSTLSNAIYNHVCVSNITTNHQGIYLGINRSFVGGFSGSIDEAVIYNGSITPRQIQAIMRGTPTTTERKARSTWYGNISLYNGSSTITGTSLANSTHVNQYLNITYKKSTGAAFPSTASLYLASSALGISQRIPGWYLNNLENYLTNRNTEITGIFNLSSPAATYQTTVTTFELNTSRFNWEIPVQSASIVLNFTSAVNVTLLTETYVKSWSNNITFRYPIENITLDSFVSIYFRRNTSTWINTNRTQYFEYYSNGQSVNHIGSNSIYILPPSTEKHTLYLRVLDSTNAPITKSHVYVRIYQSPGVAPYQSTWMLTNQRIASDSGRVDVSFDPSLPTRIEVTGIDYSFFSRQFVGFGLLSLLAHQDPYNPYIISLTDAPYSTTPLVRLNTPATYRDPTRKISIIGYAPEKTTVLLTTTYGATVRGTNITGNLLSDSSSGVYNWTLIPNYDFSQSSPADITVYLYADDERVASATIRYSNITQVEILPTPTVTPDTEILNWILFFAVVLLAGIMGTVFKTAGGTSGGFHAYLIGTIVISLIASSFLWIALICCIYYAARILRGVLTT